MAKTLKKKKPWMSVDEAISLLARNYEDGFTAADLHDLIREQTLTIHGYFMGYVLELKPVGDGVERPFGDPVVKTEKRQEHVQIPADHHGLRNTLCDREIDKSELPILFYKQPSSPYGSYFIPHQGASLPAIETTDGLNQLTERTTMATFTREQLFLRTSELYAHLAEDAAAVPETTRDDELANRAKGPAFAVIKALAVSLTGLDVKTPAMQIAKAALAAIAAKGKPVPKIAEKTLAEFIGKANY